MKECQLCKNCYTDEVATCPKDGMPTMHTLAGEPVLEGKYHLESRLGQGGMGVVYKARHAFLKTQLAIKIILPDLVGNDPQLVTRFRQEALAAAAIRHQNVVGVTDYGVIHGSIPFLVMEYVDGESLHDLLTREKVLSPEKALELMSAICAGVGAAHHQGIVHRDLKPLNIMICHDKPNLSQAVKILDFGLAKIKSGELLGSFIQAQTTGLMGSPYYMAPEQWADDEPDSRSDIYSLGVMLFQMLTGDVPFKGSSIPAIMKKHISDPPPTFTELKIPLSLEIEQAVRHTLQKEKEKRTPTVEHMIAELRTAIEPVPIGIHTTGSASDTSSLNIFTSPPRSKVFLDNVAVGESRDDGWITLNGIQYGTHKVRVSHDGFDDWQKELTCDGSSQKVVAELRPGSAERSVPAPTVAFNAAQHNTPQNLVSTQGGHSEMQKTVVQVWDTGDQSVAADSIPPQRRGFLSPLVIGVIALIGFMFLGGIGLGGAYMAGIIGGGDPRNGLPTPTATPISKTPSPTIRAEMVEIPGGTFQMGFGDANSMTGPVHEVDVAAFFIDKTEVTDAEYLEFVKATNHPPPSHWVNNAPLPGTEKKPVRFVSLADAEAFAKWRSDRDGEQYRLPTEQEWEFAARNGSKSTLYPWGNEWKADAAVMAVVGSEPVEVGSKPQGANQLGVLDMMGNVWELTSSELVPYPGNNAVDVQKRPGKRVVLRGGSAHEDPVKLKINAAFRVDVAADQKEKTVGFRLVRPK
ncbi:MAG TPA: SUMF1/EgtB/PvdO family nonheme iron enzyme [Pyrinomonadaceae bacterium]|nr:SUMF1/EgtB/PvdO family nonheme iron enzyme [Pyrinomonadaceae bacterium]